MKVTEKKCKGTGKAIGYGCGDMQLNRKYGLGVNCGCYIKFLLESDEGAKLIEKNRLKAKKEFKATKRKEHLEKKRELRDYKSKLQSEVQKLARLIDIGNPCLARGNYVEKYDGGHIYTKGAHPEMKFNLHNIHAQGRASNYSQKDDILMYEGLKRVYGKKYQSFVKSLKNKPFKKVLSSEYYEAYQVAVKWSKKLEKEGKSYNIDERIELRNKINKELLIYDEYLCQF